MDRNIIKNVIEDQQAEAFDISNETDLIIITEMELLKEYLATPLIKVIMGVRRSGKSTIALQAMKGKNFLYFNFDDEVLSQITVNKLQIIVELGLELVPNPEYFVFDEIQNIEGWELFINKLHRKKKNILLTGSNSRLLSSELSTHLTGRHLSIELLPLSFKGLHFQAQAPKSKKFRTFEDKIKLKQELLHYIDRGGFPDLQKLPIKSRVARQYLKELYDRIVHRDLIQRRKIRNFKVLRELSLVLMSQYSSRFTFQSLKRILAINSVNTVKNYVGYIQESFIGFILEPYSYKMKERISLPKKFYCIDPALAATVAGSSTNDLGKVLENIVYLELRRRFEEIYYVHHSNFEVDFLIREQRKTNELIQVCWDLSNEKTRERELNALIAANSIYKSEKLKIITFENESADWVKEGVSVQVIPAWKWLIEG